MSDLTPGTKLSVENVHLLKAGDVLRVDESSCAFSVGELVAYEKPGPLNECMVFGMSWKADRFTFVSRPDDLTPGTQITEANAGDEACDHAWNSDSAGQAGPCVDCGASVSPAPSAVETPSAEGEVDRLAQEIRRVDGNHDLGAGALAEALIPFIRALSPSAAACKCEVLREALTPSGDTKAAYHGEFKFSMNGGRENEDGEWEEFTQDVPVPWTTIKEIMVAISERARQALHAGEPG